MASATRLSLNDSAVLGALFDAEASLTGHQDMNLTEASPSIPPSIGRLMDIEREALLNVNMENPSSSDIKATVAELNNLIQDHPNYASAYNNRAQALRTLVDIDESINSADIMPLVFQDLDHAINLASPRDSSPNIHAREARILASAHTHRAYLLYRASRSEDLKQDLCQIEALAKLDSETLEAMASKDFAVGGRYGHAIAKQLAVQTNPYAKLCGSIVKQAMRKEMEDFFTGSA